MTLYYLDFISKVKVKNIKIKISATKMLNFQNLYDITKQVFKIIK